MLAVFPFDVSVSRLLKLRRMEARGLCQAAEPRDNWNIHAIGGRITDNETDGRRGLAASTESVPDRSQVTEIAGHHQVVGLLATLRKPYLSQLGADGRQFVADGTEFVGIDYFGEVNGALWNMLRAGPN